MTAHRARRTVLRPESHTILAGGIGLAIISNLQP
jgi:hypothetical protein